MYDGKEKTGASSATNLKKSVNSYPECKLTKNLKFNWLGCLSHKLQHLLKEHPTA